MASTEKENKLENDIDALQQDIIKLRRTVDEFTQKTQKATKSFEEIAKSIKQNIEENKDKDKIINTLKEKLKDKEHSDALNKVLDDKLSNINNKIDNFAQSLYVKAKIDANAIEYTQDSIKNEQIQTALTNDSQFSSLGYNIYEMKKQINGIVESNKLILKQQQIDDDKVKETLQSNILQIIDQSKQDIIKHLDLRLNEIQKQSEIVILKLKQKQLLQSDYKEQQEYECKYDKYSDKSTINELNKDEYVQQLLLLLLETKIKKLSLKFHNKLNVLNNNIILTSNKLNEINDNNTNKLMNLLQTEIDEFNTKIESNKQLIDNHSNNHSKHLKEIKQENKNGLNELKEIINNNLNKYTKHSQQIKQENERRMKYLKQIKQENENEINGLKELINNHSNNDSKYFKQIKQENVNQINDLKQLIYNYSVYFSENLQQINKCNEIRKNNLLNKLNDSSCVHSKQLIQTNKDNEAQFNNLKLFILQIEKIKNENKEKYQEQTNLNINAIPFDVKKTLNTKIKIFANNISNEIKIDTATMFNDQYKKIENKRKLMETNINKMFDDQRIKINLDIAQKLKYFENEYKNNIKNIENEEEKFNQNLYDRLDSSIKSYIKIVDESQNALFNKMWYEAQRNINEENKWWSLKMENYQQSTNENFSNIKEQLIQLKKQQSINIMKQEQDNEDDDVLQF